MTNNGLLVAILIVLVIGLVLLVAGHSMVLR